MTGPGHRKKKKKVTPTRHDGVKSWCSWKRSLSKSNKQITYKTKFIYISIENIQVLDPQVGTKKLECQKCVSSPSSRLWMHSTSLATNNKRQYMIKKKRDEINSENCSQNSDPHDREHLWIHRRRLLMLGINIRKNNFAWNKYQKILKNSRCPHVNKAKDWPYVNKVKRPSRDKPTILVLFT